MDRRERRELLERLVVLRRVYDMRSDYDRRSVLTVRATIAHGERLMRMARVAPTTAPAT